MSNHESRNEDVPSRVAVLEDQMGRLLGNGQPGMIAELRRDMIEIRQMYADAKQKVLLFVIVIVASVMVAGNGTVSLHALLQFLMK